jgi:hypothetical protein
MDERLTTILIDEPELGLSPKVQQKLASLLQDSDRTKTFFPNLKQVIIATHSHLFLNRSTPENNYTISRTTSEVHTEAITNLASFYNLQFNLLGNDLETLYFPSAIVFIEGPTDHKYLERLINQRFPEKRITVVYPGRDIKQRVREVNVLFGGLKTSPMQSRVFAVVDSIPASMKDDLVALGLSRDNVVQWDQNGIEYVYPPSLLCKSFVCSEGQLGSMTIVGDRVSIGSISKSKTELCDEILPSINNTTALPAELESKLLTPLGAAIS